MSGLAEEARQPVRAYRALMAIHSIDTPINALKVAAFSDRFGGDFFLQRVHRTLGFTCGDTVSPRTAQLLCALRRQKGTRNFQL